MIAIVLLNPSVTSLRAVLPSFSIPLAARVLLRYGHDRRRADAAGGQRAADHVDVGVDRRGVVHVPVPGGLGLSYGEPFGSLAAVSRVELRGVDGQIKTFIAGEAPVKLPPLASLYS